MWQSYLHTTGELDWDLTRTQPAVDGHSSARLSPKLWCTATLGTWADKRRERWEELEAAGRVPHFLSQWIKYVKHLVDKQTCTDSATPVQFQDETKLTACANGKSCPLRQRKGAMGQ